MNDFIELQRVISIILRRSWLLVGLSVILGLAGFTISRRQTPVYEAMATVLVGQSTQATNLSREDLQLSAAFAQTYADLAVRQLVLQGVVEMLELNVSWQDLRKQVEVTPIDGTQLIEIRAEANSPDLARSIADEVANHLILIGPTNLSEGEKNFVESFVRQQMEETQARILNGQKRINEIEAAIEGSLTPAKMFELQTEKTNLERLIADNVTNYVQLSNLAAQDRTPNSLSIIETASAKQNPIRPRVNLIALLSGGLGLILALGIIFLWEFLDDTVKSMDDLSQVGELNVLGVIGKIKGHTDSDRLITNLEPSSPTKESYRMIRNKIRLGSGNHPARSIVVTSPEPEEGKSITAANLGIIMAQAEMKTVIVDADLRHPKLHQVFDVKNKFGLADLLNPSKTDIGFYLKSTAIEHLQIITSGESTHDPSERLRSERISEILDYLKEKAEVIIIDSPPALLTADATILSDRADGVIVVVRAGQSKRRAIRHTLADLSEVNATLLGCIYNQVHKDNNLAIYKRHKQEKNLFQHLKALFNI